ncbi:hypothetical protein A3H22_04495 [Candidatus Peribacteria bacterium RIFCSPLOWO2_12_FULL_55_15]|nr:MAG: hypothetical protein A2789_01910 [Candidatus Peribacteria bacterium RIFCSPHIGHO2_01_FULL_54_22]OGJ62321.1 MAG: hypothetical protein A3D12_02170 [Candidatus Peribacteria bacterium RIFCSPHIGHO2_02_FULL_55_24]OGJ64906.1 MAG: hypothetical protein A3E47_00750 [Candidatus Peribacteria bacterium RIFCSPHIGHO2_12_FULL_54_10]OGJ67724.1 MAG: hypothetical protein A2947_03345 [Candidatus Peribacteria bacterium RIFCSPLOWO2_01_FULL_54_110]OGJ68902.1 MAG: hypothetical protein A3H90_02005 [Candidatus Pe
MPRTRRLFDQKSKEPFKLSRSKIELFLQCPRCFYLDRRLGIGRVPGPPFTLNNAVDHLLKKEFDIHRAKGKPHPLMRKYKIDAVPFAHDDLDKWRTNFTGVQYLHKKTNFLVTGAVDDVWKGKDGKLIVVDYKATAIEKEISLDDEWKQAYKRQMEIYQWLLRQRGFKVSRRGYFVYVNGRKDRAAFDGQLEFAVQIIPYYGSDKWVDGALQDAHACLCKKRAPKGSENCEWCIYRKATHSYE